MKCGLGADIIRSARMYVRISSHARNRIALWICATQRICFKSTEVLYMESKCSPMVLLRVAGCNTNARAPWPPVFRAWLECNGCDYNITCMATVCLLKGCVVISRDLVWVFYNCLFFCRNLLVALQ